MKRILLIVLLMVLIVLALVLGMKPGNGNTTPEGKGESNTTEPVATVTRTEPTETEEYAGSGDPDVFFEKYTIVKNNAIMRYSVNIKGVGDFLDVLDAVEVQTADGLPIVRHKNKLYILESDTVAREIANIWEQGYETVEFSLHDGDYVFTVNTELVDIVVTIRSLREMLLLMITGITFGYVTMVTRGKQVRRTETKERAVRIAMENFRLLA